MPRYVGKYELGCTLGSGTYSKVKHAMDTETGKAYAVKIIPKEHVPCDAPAEDLLKRDIAIMKQLRHDHIVGLHGAMQTQTHFYLVLDLVTGGELFERIVKSKKFDEPTARRYFQQLILATYFCHTQGIAHGWLKLENLLLDDKGNLKVTDFGLSKLQGCDDTDRESLLTTAVCGRLHYIAPEVLAGKEYNTHAADVWACGVILFVMLAGYLPFDDAQAMSLHDLFAKIERGEFRHARHFSESVKSIINIMLAASPLERASLDDIIAHDWFQRGFSRSELDRAKGHKMQVSVAQVASAVSCVAQSGASETSKPTGTDTAGLDAFEIISRLTAGSVSAIASGPMDTARNTTRVAVRLPPAQGLSLLLETLTTLKAHPRSKEGSPIIKGYVSANKGLLTISLTVMSSLASPDITIVELHRRHGDTLDFHDFFRKFTTSIGPLMEPLL